MTAKTASQLPLDGGPAFPTAPATTMHHYAFGATCGGTAIAGSAHTGMSLRDYFAAHALAGILARDPMGASIEWHAILAYEAADAMLKRRVLE